MNLFQETGQAVINPFNAFYNWFANSLPSLVIALVIIVFGYLIGMLLGFTVNKLLIKTGLDKWMEKQKLAKAIGNSSLSYISGQIIKWYIILLFLSEAASKVSMGIISQEITLLLGWLPKLIIAIIILVIGLIGADYVADQLKKNKAKYDSMNLLASTVKVIIIAGTIIIAVNRTELIQTQFIENLIYILIGAPALGIALALGISLGFGLKDDAEDFIQKLKKKL